VKLDLALPWRDDGVRADAGSLVQVLLNLLTNGIRHAQEHGRVAVEARRHGDRLTITVTDTGVGIAPEDQGHIFEEFYQAPNHAAGGIGLGLAISRRMAERMGGTIEVESELGRGSRFKLDLAAANLSVG
jgi:signal transduction histidine kinase